MDSISKENAIMSYSYNEFKSLILFHYHKDVNYFWKLVGEMLEKTEGFTKRYEKQCVLDGEKVTIIWDDCSW